MTMSVFHSAGDASDDDDEDGDDEDDDVEDFDTKVEEVDDDEVDTKVDVADDEDEVDRVTAAPSSRSCCARLASTACARRRRARSSLFCTSATSCRSGTAECARCAAIAAWEIANCCSSVSPCHGGNSSRTAVLFSAVMRRIKSAQVVCCKSALFSILSANSCHAFHAPRRSCSVALHHARSR